MFTIIGGDGREYGPVSADQVRSWITAGRANLETKAKAAGTDEWRRLGDFVEFMPAEQVPPAIDPATPGSSVPTAAPLAERSTRLAANFIDNVIAAVACLPGGLLFGAAALQALLSGRLPSSEDVNVAQLLLGIGLLAAAVLTVAIVQLWMLTKRGQTLGKRMLDIRIVRFADEGNPGFASAVLLRAIVPGVIGAMPYIGMVFTLVDICFIFRADRRCLHDLIAGTKVVKC
jgi:uncharacterized RDD family membrane protein YckC